MAKHRMSSCLFKWETVVILNDFALFFGDISSLVAWISSLPVSRAFCFYYSSNKDVFINTP